MMKKQIVSRSTFALLPIVGSFLLATTTSLLADDDWRGWSLGAGFIGLDEEISVDTGKGFYRTGDAGDPGFFLLHGGYTFGALGKAEGNKSWRFGMQVDLGFGNHSETATDPILGDIEIDGEFYFSGLTRFGYSWDRVWLYGLAGVSGSDLLPRQAGDDSTKVVAIGSVGLGMEYRFTENCSLNLEYLTSHGGDFEQAFSGTDRNVSVEHNSLKLGVTWRF